MLQSWAYVRGPGCSGRWRPRLGPRLQRRHALYGPCVSRTGFSPSTCGRRTLAELYIFRTLDRECSLHLSLLAGELVVGTHAAPSHVELFAHMVPCFSTGAGDWEFSDSRVDPGPSLGMAGIERRG